MKLKPTERSAIAAREHPEIVRTGKKCPFKVGEQIVLRAQKAHGAARVPLLSITIIGYDKLKTGAWRAEYRVRDDRGLYLAKGGRYTRSPAESIDPEASVEDEATLKRYAAQGRLARAERKEDSERARRDSQASLKQLGKELWKLQAQASRYGVDLSPKIAAMIQEGRAEIAKHRAA